MKRSSDARSEEASPLARRSPQAWRTVAALAWCAVVLGYLSYAAMTYTGPYAWLAEIEQSVFGAYDPAMTFIVLLIGLCLPIWTFAPSRTSTTPTPTAGGAARPHPAQRPVRWQPWAIAGLLAIAASAGGLALWRAARTPVVASVELAHGSTFPANADQLVVTGRPVGSHTVIVTETTRGSVDRTAYTPMTAAGAATEPIRFVMREGSYAGDQPAAREAGASVRFGPAVPFTHAVPGIVRSAWTRDGLTLADDVVVLDRNLESGNFTLWIIAFFALAFAIGLGAVWWLVAGAQRRLAASSTPSAAPLRRSSSAAPESAARVAEAVPQPARQSVGPPRHWRLMLGPELMAQLDYERYETPWISVRVRAEPGLVPFLRYFNDPDTWPDDDPSIDAMVAEVERRGRFALFDGAGKRVDPFTLVNLDETGAELRL